MSNDPSKGKLLSLESTIAHVRLQRLLESQGGISYQKTDDGQIAYLMPNDSVVRLPSGHGRIAESIVREIAEIKCEMSGWDYDYWLTNQDRGTNLTPPKVKRKKKGNKGRRK